jgi:hypothetical protein
MHGPTVMQYKTLTAALEKLYNLKHSNGGLYRVLDDRGKQYAALDTYATYSPLNYEANHKQG